MVSSEAMVLQCCKLGEFGDDLTLKSHIFMPLEDHGFNAMNLVFNQDEYIM